MTRLRRLRMTTMQQIDDTLYDASASAHVSTIFTQLNQYHVVLEVAKRQALASDALHDLRIKFHLI